jgi:hypothetical protein
MASTRKLISIEIKTPKHVYNRSVICAQEPVQTDLEYYYTRLCGLDASVTFRILSIPEDFNEALLATIDRAPTKFPSHDLETGVDDDEKRKQYNNFITQLCEMEHSRAALRVFVRSEQDAQESNTFTRRNIKLDSTRNWVNQLLRTLNDEHDYEEQQQNQNELMVAPDCDAFCPIGWIFTPVVPEMRESKGSRIVLDPAIGQRWEKLLGTDLFPDLVVSRRISTLTWAFQHRTSDALVKATLEWYLASQDAEVKEGVSGWIPEADREMTALFASFKRIKVHERLIMEGLPKASEKNGQLFTILSSVESRLLASSLETEEVHPCSHEVFQKYISYLFRGFGLAKETYSGNEAVNQILLRWARASLGFRGGVEPLLDSWKEMWQVVMRNRPTAERVYHFLKTLDCWDPIEASILSAPQKKVLATEWVNIYIDNETIAEEKAKERSTLLHSQTKDWCLKFLPESVFPTSFTPMQIGPMYTQRGFNSIKRSDGRYTLGLRFKHQPTETVETVAAAIHVAATHVSVPVPMASAQQQQQQQEAPQNIIINMFKSTETHELHIGTL